MKKYDYDGGRSFAFVKKQVDHEVKKGGLSIREAHSIITDARESYRKNNYSRAMDKINAR